MEMINFIEIEVEIQPNYDKETGTYTAPLVPRQGQQSKVLSFSGKHINFKGTTNFWNFVIFKDNLIEKAQQGIGKIVKIKGSMQQNYYADATCSHKNTPQIVVNDIVPSKLQSAKETLKETTENSLKEMDKFVKEENTDDLPW